jgi:predicted DNA repair protein MutK
VVIDDTAVTPRYVHGFTADRELPVVKRIAIGSLRNKLLFILPAAMLLSQFASWLLTPLLMLGGVYLCYEGAEKIWEKLAGHEHPKDTIAALRGPEQEAAMVTGAIRTDFILSAEIMVISLNEVASEPFLSRLVILVVVALAITALVYGVVALIVKMDDVGLHMAARPGDVGPGIGRGLVRGMPKLLALLSVVGIAAMIWVGGHILIVGFDDLGWSALYDLVHHLEKAAADAVSAIGGVVGWFVNTAASALIGLVVGAAAVAVMHVVPRRRRVSPCRIPPLGRGRSRARGRRRRAW